MATVSTVPPDTPTSAALKKSKQPGGASSSSGQTNSSHRAPRENREMQTESSFYPSDVNEMADQLTELHCNEFEQLKLLRSKIQETMTDFGASIYDLFSFKDILLSMSDRLPDMPVTDLLLISSKMFRRGSELSSELSTFFSIVFNENYIDDHFKFTEVRLLKKEMMDMKAQLEVVKQERDSFQQQYQSMSDGAKNHQNVVENLEDRNDVLEVRAAALEDQMAVLFQQLTDDFIFYNEGLVQKTGENLEVQEQLSSARSTFTQSIDAVQNRLRFFQNMLVEIQEDASMVSLDGAGSVKARIKALDVHVQHIIGRFSSVKEGLVTTSQELVTALQEKRNVLNFAVQHLKLYDSQNQKLRTSRALMHEMRQKLTEIERSVSHTFSTGSFVKVDRGGDVHITPPTQSDGSIGKRNRYAVDHVRDITGLIELTQDIGVQLTTQLDTEDEQKTLLKSVSLATPSTTRDGTAPPAGSRMPRLPGEQGADAFQLSKAVGGRVSPGAGAGAASSSATGAYSQEQYQRLRDDFATKLTFMREVYEERISDLESKVERAADKVKQAQNEAAQALGQALQQKKEEDDREAAMKAKEKWVNTKQRIGGQEQDDRHAALDELQKMETELVENELVNDMESGGNSPQSTKGGGGRPPRRGSLAPGDNRRKSFNSPHHALRSYVSPLYKTASKPEYAQASGSGDDDLKPQISRTTTVAPGLHRTSYSKEQQNRNAEVLRTMRRLTKVEISEDELAGEHATPHAASKPSSNTKSSSAKGSGSSRRGSVASVASEGALESKD